VHRLEGNPPTEFDCGREAQNRFLHGLAWHDQQEWLSCTYLHFLGGTYVAYATVCMDAVPLGTREKPRAVPYRYIGALKLAQFGVDRRFQGQGLGLEVLADVVHLAREAAERYGCRYVSLDAHPELVPWYEQHGFVINKLAQKQRTEATAGKVDPASLSVSMRLDLRPPAPHLPPK
jgi:GNAT superfamily N-acetyltransferase